MKAPDFLRDFQPGARELSLVAQKFLRTLASRDPYLIREFFELLQAALVELLDVIKPFDRPLQILFAAILVFFRLHLIGESDDVADVERTGGQFIADPEKFNHRDWRTRNRLFSTLLAALDALRNRYLLLACKQRHYAHFAHVDANGIRSFIHLAGGKVELDLFAHAFIRL